MAKKDIKKIDLVKECKDELSTQYVLDALDKKIVVELQKDARMPYKMIAKLLNVSDATIGQRVKNMVSKGILKLEARINPLAAPEKVAALIAINVNENEIIDELKKLQNLPYVTSVWTGTGPYSIFVEVMVDSIRELNRLLFKQELNKYRGISRTETFILLDSETKFFKLAEE
jgi:Lrp/AsnC family transcriptional regulator, regulator for asnA, asnC and gidA